MKSEQFSHLGSNLKIEYISCSQLKPYKNNPRTHSNKQINQIVNSIKEFGFTNPILVDGDNNIIAGHGRVSAAKKLGMNNIPIIQLEHLSEVQKRAYIIADNKLAENAGWDMELLQTELEYISELDMDFDLTLTGFETTELDLMFSNNDVNPQDDVIPEASSNAVSKIGDIWQLWQHRIICADATDPNSYKLLLEGKKADMIFTDPPYNVPIDGHVCGNGKVKHEDFKMVSGEMSEGEFTNFLAKVFSNLCDYSRDGSLHYICMDWRHMQEVLSAGKEYSELNNLCVWNKTNGGMGSFYRSKHELVFVYKNGKSQHLNNIELGSNGRYRTNVWDYAGVNTFQNNDNLKMHPTVKPVAMIQDAILDCTKVNALILDVFGGSGSTLIAAENSDRVANIIELDPKYVDVMIRRWQDATKKFATNQDGVTFDQLAGESNE